MVIMFRKYHLDNIIQLPAVPGQKPPPVSPAMSPVLLVQIQHIFQISGHRKSSIMHRKLFHWLNPATAKVYVLPIV